MGEGATGSAATSELRPSPRNVEARGDRSEKRKGSLGLTVCITAHAHAGATSTLEPEEGGRAEVQHNRGASWHAGVKMPRRMKVAEGTSGCGKGPQGTGRCGRELMRCPSVPDVLIRALPILESLILAFLRREKAEKQSGSLICMMLFF